MNDRQALETAVRLGELGITIRSAELTLTADRYRQFYEGGGNRAMRRAAKRGQRKRGR